MSLQHSALRDTRYEVTEWGTERRRYVPREEIEQQLRRWFADKGVELPADAFVLFSDEQLYYRWLDCLYDRGLTTVYGPLPIEFISILEKDGYDPMGETGLPAWLFRHWQRVPNPPDFPQGNAREPDIP